MFIKIGQESVYLLQNLQCVDIWARKFLFKSHIFCTIMPSFWLLSFQFFVFLKLYKGQKNKRVWAGWLRIIEHSLKFVTLDLWWFTQTQTGDGSFQLTYVQYMGYHLPTLSQLWIPRYLCHLFPSLVVQTIGTIFYYVLVSHISSRHYIFSQYGNRFAPCCVLVQDKPRCVQGDYPHLTLLSL